MRLRNDQNIYVVDYVEPGSPADTWNLRQAETGRSEFLILPGDRLLSINGATDLDRLNQELLQKDASITFERLSLAMSNQRIFHVQLIRDKKVVDDEPCWGFSWHGDLFRKGIRLMEDDAITDSPLGEWNRNITREGFAQNTVTSGDRLIAVNGFLHTEGACISQELRSVENVRHDGRITAKCTFLRWVGPVDSAIGGSYFPVLLVHHGRSWSSRELAEWGFLWNPDDLNNDSPEYILKGVVPESPADEWNQAHFCSDHRECCLLLGDQLLEVNGIKVSDQVCMQVALRDSRISCRFFDVVFERSSKNFHPNQLFVQKCDFESRYHT